MKKTKILWNKIPIREQTFPKIPTDIGDLDLHSFTSLEDINFNINKNTLSISFTESEKNKLNIGKTIISKCEIIFKNPIKYILSKRDPEMPEWCDKITEDIILFENAKYKEIQFLFHGGRTLLISAEKVSIFYDSSSGQF